MLLCCFFAAHVAAQEAVEAVLYDTTLRAQQIVLLDLDAAGQRVVYYDRAGERLEIGFDEIVRLSFSSSQAVDSSLPVLATVDGQRLVGRAGQLIRPAAVDEESIAWRSVDGFSVFSVSLDDLAWVVIDAAVEPPSAPPGDDVLVLATDERLLGFVDTLGLNATRFVIGDARDPVAIQPSRVSALFMSNAWTPPQGPNIIATFASGSRVRCGLGRMDDKGLVVGLRAALHGDVDDLENALMRVRLGDGGATDPASRGWPVVTQLDFQVGGHRLVALSALTMTVQQEAEPFGVAVAVRVTTAGNVAMHATSAVSFALPEGATRLSATIALALDEDVPEERHRWAGCVVIVSVGEVELARETIDAERPEVALNVALPQSETLGEKRALSVRVEEGVNGPVLDRIELRDAEVLVSVGD